MSIRPISHAEREESTAHADCLKSIPRAPSIEQMPNEILAHVAALLPTSRIEKGPALALQSMENLVCVSKKMHLVFNDLHVTYRFLEAYGDKYGKEVEEVAIELKTMGAYLFLHRYICAHHLDKTYAITRKLHSLIARVCCQAEQLFLIKKGVLSVDMCDGSRYFITGNVQTMTSFVLYISCQFVKVAHPFGVILIYNNWWQRSQCSDLILPVAIFLIDLLEAHFQGFVSSVAHHLIFDRNLDWRRETLFRAVPIETLGKVKRTKRENINSEQFNEKAVGQDLVLNASGRHYSCYLCRRAFETVLSQSDASLSPITPARRRLIQVLVWMFKRDRKMGGPKVSIDRNALTEVVSK